MNSSMRRAWGLPPRPSSTFANGHSCTGVPSHCRVTVAAVRALNSASCVSEPCMSASERSSQEAPFRRDATRCSMTPR